jgi:predicted nucleic-acid-binding Zn-ribbon protein
MKRGTCPKCNSKAVYTKRKGISMGDGGFHVFTGGISQAAPLDTFVCTSCGYFESYIAEPAKLEAVAKTWQKVA